MEQFLIDSTWLTLSAILELSVEDTRAAMQSTYANAKFGTLDKKRYSDEVLKALTFYANNYEILERESLND